MKTKSGELSLRDIISNKKYLIPMYQRGYKWNSNVVKKLINDIVSCYKINIKKSVGLLTLYEHENVYDIIDGQQRFTTLAIILTYLNSDINIDLHFERDEQLNPIRYNAIFNNENYESTDTNRINRNRETLIDVISEDFADEKNKKILADFILDNVTMLCSVVNNQPMEEFMNLNAYKTGFSVCDYIRANLISLNSFHKTEMEKKDINQILSWSLSNHSYKTAVAVLYNDIQNKLYRRYNLSDGKYKGIYELLIDQKLVDAKIMIIPVYESRINIIFKGLLNKNAEDYSSNEITENFDYWIRMLQKLAYTNRILDELEEELKQGEYHSFKQIDDYQLTTKNLLLLNCLKE